MKALIDSGVWWKRYHRLPLHHRLQDALARVTEWYLCPLNVEEMLYKWRHKALPAPPVQNWLAHSLQSYRPALLSFEAASSRAPGIGNMATRWIGRSPPSPKRRG